MAKLADWDAPLQALWQRRDDLDEREWEQLYQITFRILRAYAFPEHQGLNLPLDDCITDFFVQKVYEPTVREGYSVNTPIHANALRCYFQRFLLDVQRAHPGRASLDDAQAEREMTALSWQEFLDAEPDTTDLEESFVGERYQTAAREFLEQQESWVGLYLRYHLCAHYCGKNPVPLVRFRNHIPSYHQKAEKLGLKKRSDDEPGDPLRHTLLGRWLRSLDLTLTADDDRDRIQIALKILCQQSLLWVKDELPFTDAADSAHSEKD